MWVQKVDANGKAVLDENGKPVLIWVDAPNGEQNDPKAGVKLLTSDEAEKITRDAVSKARKEEKDKLYSDLERTKKQHADLEAKLAEKERAEKEARLQQLPVNEQFAAKLSEMEQAIARERAARAELETKSAQQLRKISLVAYRERALRDAPEEVHSFIGGESEEEIDAAVDAAKDAYSRLESKLRNDLTKQYEQKAAPAPVPTVVPQAPTPPQNPAYVPPVPQQYVAHGGFPTPTNPLPVPEQPADISLSDLTTEGAVRNGRYGGEMRERIHSALKGQLRYPGQLGSTPRHWNASAPANHAQLPNGVMQPQGYPTVAPASAGFHQPNPMQHGAQVPPNPQSAARAAAVDAVARTHSGANPVMGSPEVQALRSAQQFAQQNGVASPQAAFNERFAPTPPVTPGQN